MDLKKYVYMYMYTYQLWIEIYFKIGPIWLCWNYNYDGLSNMSNMYILVSLIGYVCELALDFMVLFLLV